MFSAFANAEGESRQVFGLSSVICFFVVADLGSELLETIEVLCTLLILVRPLKLLGSVATQSLQKQYVAAFNTSFIGES